MPVPPGHSDAPTVTIFLMADAVLSGKAQQKTRDRYYNIEQLLKRAFSAAKE
jgi:sulfur relay (sulfurtransferase) complex TusBCD TusD component (DsrE family)